MALGAAIAPVLVTLVGERAAFGIVGALFAVPALLAVALAWRLLAARSR